MGLQAGAGAKPRSGHVLVFLVVAPPPVTMSDPRSIFSPSVVLHECEEQQFLFIHLAQNCV